MILILGGTAGARALAEGLKDREAVVALAGATAHPARHALPFRTGGFGGAEGLARWLRDHDARGLIDATHPFAARISPAAVQAARIAKAPAISLLRPPWTPGPGDRWREVSDLSAAIAAPPPGARVFCALGAGATEAVAARRDVISALRVVDPPAAPFPGNGVWIAARPPFDEAAERAALSGFGATHLIARNAGGPRGREKLAAARALGVEVILIARPAYDAAPALPLDEALAWARARARPKPDASAPTGA